MIHALAILLWAAAAAQVPAWQGAPCEPPTTAGEPARLYTCVARDTWVRSTITVETVFGVKPTPKPVPNPLPPESVAPANPANYLTITERAGIETLNYPVQIGRPFSEGEIKDAPLVLVDGAKVPAQADVKTRWPDGSVRHAIIAFLVPKLAAGASVKVQFAAGGTAGAGMDRAAMLATDFDALVKVGQKAASARQMLVDGHYTVWSAGLVATSIVLADHSTERIYDVVDALASTTSAATRTGRFDRSSMRRSGRRPERSTSG